MNSRSAKRTKAPVTEVPSDADLYKIATQSLPIMRSACDALTDLTSENLAMYANAAIIPGVVENALLPEPLVPIALKPKPVIVLRDNVCLPEAIAHNLLRQCWAKEHGGFRVLVTRDGALCLHRFRIINGYLWTADSTVKLKETPGLSDLIAAVNTFVQSFRKEGFELSIAEFRSLLIGLASSKGAPPDGMQELITSIEALRETDVDQLDLSNLGRLGGRTRPLYDTLLGLKLGSLSFEELVKFLSSSPMEETSKRAILCVHPDAAIPYIKGRPTVYDNLGQPLVPVKISELTDDVGVQCTHTYVTQAGLGQISANSLVFTDPVYTKIGSMKGGAPKLTETPATDAIVSGRAVKFLASLNKTKAAPTATAGGGEVAATPTYQVANL